MVLDTLGGDTGEFSLKMLRPGGHLVTMVSDEDVALIARSEAAGMRFSGIAVDPGSTALQHLVDLVDQGRLRVHVQETFPFENIAHAHRLIEAGNVQGKLVVTT